MLWLWSFRTQSSNTSENSILSYLCVVHLGDVRVCVHVCPHQCSDQRHGGRGRGVLGALGLGGKTTSPSLETVRPDHLLDHAGGQALLEPAELAAVPPPLVHGAVLVRQTHILGVLLHRPLEEPLAALAGPHTVVLARCKYQNTWNIFRQRRKY